MNCNNQIGDIYSIHNGGGVVAFADGHVTFLSKSIDINVLVPLVTRGGGEIDRLGKASLLARISSRSFETIRFNLNPFKKNAENNFFRSSCVVF